MAIRRRGVVEVFIIADFSRRAPESHLDGDATELPQATVHIQENSESRFMNTDMLHRDRRIYEIVTIAGRGSKPKSVGEIEIWDWHSMKF